MADCEVCTVTANCGSAPIAEAMSANVFTVDSSEVPFTNWILDCV